MALRHIAKNLGISITTVSRGLAGHTDVAAATRARVRAEAERLGYVPNEVARRLQSGRADAFGLVVPGGPRAFEDRYFSTVIDGACARLAGTGVDLLVMSAPDGPDEVMAHRRLVESGRVDGMIVARPRPDDARVAYLAAQGVPVVVFGGRPDVQGIAPHVTLDSYGAQQMAVGHLAVLGHRRIAMLSAERSYLFGNERVSAFLRVAEEMGIEPVVARCALDEAGGHRAVAALLAADRPPTAFLAATDRIGIGATQAIRKAGLRIGRDVALVAFGDCPALEFANPPISALRVPTRAMAAHAVEMLLDLRDGRPAAIRPDWPAELLVRESSGPAPRGGPVLATLGEAAADPMHVRG